MKGWLRRWRKRIRTLLLRDTVERELDEELSFHLEMETEKNIREGMTPREARRQAAIKFGGMERYKEKVREARTLGWVPGMSLDFKLGARMLRKYPGLTAVSVLAVAFAIAVAAISFEFFTQIVIPRLPFEDGDRVVAIVMQDAASGAEESRILHDFEGWRRDLKTVEDLGAYRAISSNLVVGGGPGTPVSGAEITASAFRLAQVPPLLGRTLVESDEQPSAPPVIVIGQEVWQARFNEDPNVLGREVSLGSTTHTIVGVMPKGFGFPVAQRAWVPFRFSSLGYEMRQGPGVKVFGRLSPGVTVDEAQAEVTTVLTRSAADSPETHQHLRARVLAYPHSVVSVFGPEIVGLTSINLLITCLLALVCGNVALLFFARAASRESEIVVRAALGASRRRLITQLFIEALVMAGVAVFIGAIAAQLSLRWFVDVLGTEFFGVGGIPFWFRASLSPGTFPYLALLTITASGLSGILPGIKVTRGLGTRLKDVGQYGGELRFGGVWTALIVTQVAVMALAPIFLFIISGESSGIRSRFSTVGFPTEEYLTATIGMDLEVMPGVSDTVAAADFLARYLGSYQELGRQLETEPEVISVTFADRLPLTYHPHRRIELDDGPAAPIDEQLGHRRVTSANVAVNFFQTLDAPVLLGRGFDDIDLNPDGRAVVVDEKFVEKMLGGSSPIGRRFRYRYFEELESPRSGDEPWYEIVGVVRNLGMRWAGIYHPLIPESTYPVRVAIHLRGDPLLFASRLRTMATALDPNIQLHRVVSLDSVRAADLSVYRMWFWVTVLVTSVVMVLSLMGIHAVLSFVATRRTKEVGIRMALGGQSWRVMAPIFRRQMVQVAIGILAGLFIAGVLSTRHIIPVLGYGSVIILVCSIATVEPVRRALRVQPTEALRVDQ